MKRVDGALNRLSTIAAGDLSSNIMDHSQQLTARSSLWEPRPVTHDRRLKENRDSLNQRPIGMDKQQLKSMTTKLLRVRNNLSPLN